MMVQCSKCQTRYSDLMTGRCPVCCGHGIFTTKPTTATEQRLAAIEEQLTNHRGWTAAKVEHIGDMFSRITDLIITQGERISFLENAPAAAKPKAKPEADKLCDSCNATWAYLDYMYCPWCGKLLTEAMTGTTPVDDVDAVHAQFAVAWPINEAFRLTNRQYVRVSHQLKNILGVSIDGKEYVPKG